MRSKIWNKIYLFVLLGILIFILFPYKTYASQDMKELNFNIEITNSGDMIITENWIVNVSDTNTLFKTFEKDGSYDEITDVSVTETTETPKRFTRSNEYQYHVDKDYFQALTNKDGLFEIAWGIDQEGNKTREFVIKYTVKGHIVKYNDCAEIYWKLIGDDFGISIDKISGVINLPTEIENLEDLRVWAHGPLNGTITKSSNSSVSFSVNDLPSKNFLEIRIATPAQIFENAMKISNADRLDTIISEETAWANEANAKRERVAKTQEMQDKLRFAGSIIVLLFLVYKYIKNVKILKNTPKKESQNLDYFREIPDETTSAAEAGFLYYFSDYGINREIGKIISGTMLNLCLKGWIIFEQESEDKKKVNITLNKSGKETLTEDEKCVYEFLTKIPENNSDKFSMKDFQDYCNNNYRSTMSLVTEIPKITETEAEQKELFNKKIRKDYNNKIVFAVLYIFFAIFMFVIAIGEVNSLIILLITILSIMNCSILITLASRNNGLTQKGIDEKEKWNGLKRYMEDFSLLNEREVPDLVLWEKYLVFATVFGIADKVIKQLKVRYPELNDEEYLRSHYAYMYMISSNNNFNFISSMSSSIGSVTNYSSGSGSGGGFSSGGGFGRRWRWRRWPLTLI